MRRDVTAVARIASEVEEIAVLDEVHLASEGDDPNALCKAAATCLDMSLPLTE